VSADAIPDEIAVDACTTGPMGDEDKGVRIIVSPN
jgi:hypothetical protein